MFGVHIDSVNSKPFFKGTILQKELQENDNFMIILALTCDFQQCGILTSVDSGKPVQPPFKLRNSKLCSVSSLTVIGYSSN